MGFRILSYSYFFSFWAKKKETKLHCGQSHALCFLPQPIPPHPSLSAFSGIRNILFDLILCPLSILIMHIQKISSFLSIYNTILANLSPSSNNTTQLHTVQVPCGRAFLVTSIPFDIAATCFDHPIHCCYLLPEIIIF